MMNESAIPSTLQHTGLQYSTNQTKANLEKDQHLSKLLEEIREKCLREIYELLGSKTNDCIEFRKKNTEIARAMQPLFTATPEGRKIRNQFQNTRLYEVNKFFKSIGIDPRDIKSIRSKYHEESKSVIEKTMAVEGTLELVAGPIPPDVVDPDPGNPWHSIHPPYFYSLGDRYSIYSGRADQFGPNRMSHEEDYLTGKVSCFNDNFILRGGDYAYQLTTAYSAILIYFQMPASGRLSIWSQLQCVESSY